MTGKPAVDWGSVYAAAIPGDWATVLEISARPLAGTEFDATVLWCQALVAARSAALEEAAKVADIEASTDKYATDSQAHRIAADIRELKDK